VRRRSGFLDRYYHCSCSAEFVKFHNPRSYLTLYFKIFPDFTLAGCQYLTTTLEGMFHLAMLSTHKCLVCQNITSHLRCSDWEYRFSYCLSFIVASSGIQQQHGTYAYLVIIVKGIRILKDIALYVLFVEPAVQEYCYCGSIFFVYILKDIGNRCICVKLIFNFYDPTNRPVQENVYMTLGVS
jgi:hypothetical protein